MATFSQQARTGGSFAASQSSATFAELQAVDRMLRAERQAHANTRQSLAAAKGGPQAGEVPLMLDPRSTQYREMTPWKSIATNEMALPGPKLSSVGGARF